MTNPFSDLPAWYPAERLLKRFDISANDLRQFLTQQITQSAAYHAYLHAAVEMTQSVAKKEQTLVRSTSKKHQETLDGCIAYLVYTLMKAPITAKHLKQFTEVYLQASQGTPIRLNKDYYVMK